MWFTFGKGQLISKCLLPSKFGPEWRQKYCKDFCLEILCRFLRPSWKLLGLPEDFLINDITYLLSPQKAPKFSSTPRKLQKIFQGRNPYNIFVAEGQVILKSFFGVFNFFQKNERKHIALQKNEFIRSFFGRIHSLTICFRN